MTVQEHSTPDPFGHRQTVPEGESCSAPNCSAECVVLCRRTILADEQHSRDGLQPTYYCRPPHPMSCKSLGEYCARRPAVIWGEFFRAHPRQGRGLGYAQPACVLSAPLCHNVSGKICPVTKSGLAELVGALQVLDELFAYWTLGNAEDTLEELEEVLIVSLSDAQVNCASDLAWLTA